MADAIDHEYMSHALRLAANGLHDTAPNPTVGCVLVGGGRVVGTGWTAPAGGPHAEVVALTAAGAAARGATAYVTLEPCCHTGRTGPCTKALIEAGVARVVYAGHDPNPRVDGGGARQLVAAGIAVEGGVMERSAEPLNRGFFTRMRTGLPYVRSKLAVSLDGRTALANGTSKWITSAAARVRCSSLARSLERRVDGQRHDRRRRSVARCAPQRSRHRWRDRHQATPARHRRCQAQDAAAREDPVAAGRSARVDDSRSSTILQRKRSARPARASTASPATRNTAICAR